MSTLTLINGKIRHYSSSGTTASLVLSPKPGSSDPCCCKCSCIKRKVFEWVMSGNIYYFSPTVLCSSDYCGCEKYQIIARRTNPPYYNYPRIIESGIILAATPSSTADCCLARGSQFRSHLGLKGYTVYYELWIMCAKKPDDITNESALEYA